MFTKQTNRKYKFLCACNLYNLEYKEWCLCAWSISKSLCCCIYLIPDLRNTVEVLSPWAETFIPLSEKRLKGFEKSLITPATLLNPNANIFIPRETLGSLSEHDDGVDSHVPSDYLTPTRWADLSIPVNSSPQVDRSRLQTGMGWDFRYYSLSIPKC